MNEKNTTDEGKIQDPMTPKEALIQAAETFLKDVEPLSKYTEALSLKYQNDVLQLRKPYEQAFESYLDSELKINGVSVQVGMELKRGTNRYVVMDRNIPFKDNKHIYEPFVVVKRVLNKKLVGNYITLVPVAKSSQNTLGEYSIYATMVGRDDTKGSTVPDEAPNESPLSIAGSDCDGPVGEDFGHCGCDPAYYDQPENGKGM